MASIEETEALADRLADALAHVLDNHFSGHCCHAAVDVLHDYELRSGRPAVPLRLASNRGTLVQAAREAIVMGVGRLRAR